MLGEHTEKMFGMLPVIFPRDAVDVARALRETAIVFIALQGPFGPFGSAFKGLSLAARGPFSGLIDRLHLFLFLGCRKAHSECVWLYKADRFDRAGSSFSSERGIAPKGASS
jgi:hypothetical protein